MKKILFLLAMLPMMCYAQNVKTKKCKVEGTVTFKLGNAEGNKVDVGAIVYFIPSSEFNDDYITKLDSIKSGIKSQYLYDKIYKTLFDKEQTIRLVGKSYIPYSQTLRRETEFNDIYYKIKKGKYARCLIDSSGKYEIDIPEGEYYIMFKSSNKTLDLSTIFGSGIIDITKENIKANQYNIISNVFEIIIAK